MNKINEEERMIYLNNKKKTILIILCIISLLALNFLNFINSVKAVSLGEVNIHSAGDCGSLLKYRGIVVKVAYAQYIQDGKAFPAYCLDKTKSGVEGNFQYNVTVEDSIKDVGIWRVIINGYPYKTIEELGVANKEEAFTATKQALYCYIHGNQLSDYEPIGEAGKRTLDAMYKIVNSANSSTETQVSTNIVINKNDTQWKQDDKEKEYISKTYSITAPTNIDNYKVNITNEKGEKIDYIKLTDENNNEKEEFSQNEKFKVLVPIKQAKEKQEFNISVQTKVETKPILYGRAPNSSYQDYALTGVTYEDGTGNAKDEYIKNETKIIIIKQDEETKEKLEGVEFQLLDENKNVVYTNLKTNKEGKIVIENLVPGRYYIKEINAKDGYNKYEELIAVDTELNEEVIVTINNKKEDKPEVEISKSQKEVKTQEVKRLPVTGM